MTTAVQALWAAIYRLESRVCLVLGVGCILVPWAPMGMLWVPHHKFWKSWEAWELESAGLPKFWVPELVLLKKFITCTTGLIRPLPFIVAPDWLSTGNVCRW